MVKMPAGRPPKPTALKLLHGNPGKRALPTHEPKPSASHIERPSWLKDAGYRIWKQIAPQLEAMGVLTDADPHALALLCDAYSEYLEARAVVRAQGLTFQHVKVVGTKKNEAGEEEPILSVMVRQRPEVAIASDAWKRVSAMMQQFGMTPSARTKVQVTQAEEADPFEARFG